MSSKKIPFTMSSIEGLPPALAGRRDTYYDNKVPHLAIRVTETGTKTFVVYKWVDGRPLKRTIGRFPELTVEAARKIAQETNVSLERGEDPLIKTRQARDEITLGELFDQYMQLYATGRCASWKDIQANFNRQFADWKSRRISTIKKVDVQVRINRLGEGGHPQRANKAHDALRAVFTWGIKKGLIQETNPCVGIDRYKTVARERFINHNEFEAFLKSLAAEPNTKLRDFIYLSLYTGARQNNVLSMRWEEIDFEAAIWRIPKTKNGDPLTVPLTTKALQILIDRHQQRHGDCAWVFPGSGDTGHLVEPKVAWRRIVKNAGLTDLRMHDLRRTLGSYMAMRTQSLHIIGKALGHKSHTSTQIYARLSNDPVRQAMEMAQEDMHQAARRSDKAKNVISLSNLATAEPEEPAS